MKKPLKRWIISGVILLVVFGTVLFWPALRVYLAPKTILAAALTDTYSALQHRVKNSPFVLIGNTLDFVNGNTIDLHLDKEDAILGSVEYDMMITGQWNPKQIAASGAVTTKGKTLDLSLYVDSDFVALSSAGMLGGNFYGLTYDTFSQDIRANRFIPLVAGEKVIKEWEERINNLHSFMTHSYVAYELSESDIRNILAGVLALKADVGRESAQINGISEECFVISFETTGEEIASGLNYLNMDIPIQFSPNEEVNIAFWIFEGAVIKLEIEDDSREVELDLGPKPASDDINFRYEDAGELLTISVSTQQNDSVYRETVIITGRENRQISYEWNLDNGDLLLNTEMEGEQQTLFLNLSETENGFNLETKDFEALMHVIAGSVDSANSMCSMAFTKGADITTPTYKNFSDWSLEDLVTLLTGLGSLFGIRIE